MKKLLAALMAALTVGVVHPSPASASTTTAVSASLTRTSVVATQPASVTGTVSGPRGRSVALEMRTGTGWRRLTTVRTDSAGHYAIAAPTGWYNRHTLRVVVPAVSPWTAATTSERYLRVAPSYTPSGSATDWKPISSLAPRWNPCAPITWKFNLNGGYAGALDDVKGALTRITRATGLRFSYQGPTGRVAFRDGNDPTVALTISFASPIQVSQLSGATAGIGGSRYQYSGTSAEYFSGALAIDRTASLRTGFASSGSATFGQVILHELGHVVGLGHAAGSSQLMYGSAGSSNHLLGAGDLAGLHRLGAQAGCIRNSIRTV